MAGSNRKHPQHTFAMDDELWEAWGKWAAEQGTDRTKLINRFARWCLREEGVTLPRRPPAKS